MEIVIWILQGIAALLFFMAGIIKLTRPIEKLIQSGMTFVERYPLSAVKFIGVVEVLGALGVVLPWAFNILPMLTPIAATGLALIMILAMLDHWKHNESKSIVFNCLLFVMLVFIAIMRF